MSLLRFIVAIIVVGQLGVGPGTAASQTLIRALPASSALVVPSDSGSIAGEFFPQIEAEGLPAGSHPAFPGLWSWQPLPEGLMYRSYLAGPREARFESVWLHERDKGSFWDIALGGRAGMIRYGTEDPLWPEGYQLDIEGAAFPRLALDGSRDLISVDFRFGIPLTYRSGPWETKFGYYHLSSHLGDEYLDKHPEVRRINYVRDSLILGLALRPHRDFRFYAETGWAFYTDGGAEPWEILLGAEFAPETPTGFCGSPFFAIGSHLRQEADFGGNLIVRTGWQWRGPTGRALRLGVHYLNGTSNQYQFHAEHEEQIGAGLWFDY